MKQHPTLEQVQKRREKLLESLGLDDLLYEAVEPDYAPPVQTAKVDQNTLTEDEVEEVPTEFDKDTVSQFWLPDIDDWNRAYRVLFDSHKYRRGDPRNSLLHSHITVWLNRQKALSKPKPTGYVKNKIRAAD